MVEFAIVVVLLVTLVYGIVSVGLTLAAKVTLTQAATDGARAGIVFPLTSTNTVSAAALAAAANTAANDVNWMGRGTCGNATSGTTITCVATSAACTANPSQLCLTVTVTYHYAQSPIFPAIPGMQIVLPNTITSSSTLQVSNPSS
jgi:Flp pilus assembly protein TadG